MQVLRQGGSAVFRYTMLKTGENVVNAGLQWGVNGSYKDIDFTELALNYVPGSGKLFFAARELADAMFDVTIEGERDIFNGKKNYGDFVTDIVFSIAFERAKSFVKHADNISEDAYNKEVKKYLASDKGLKLIKETENVVVEHFFEIIEKSSNSAVKENIKR